MNLELDTTKTGNHAIDILDPVHDIEAVVLEQNQNITCIYYKEKNGEPLSCVLIPQRGMLFQISGELFRLVEIRREFKGTEEEWTEKTIQDHQRDKEFRYYAVLVPSLKYIDGLNVVWLADGINLCNRREEMCNG